MKNIIALFFFCLILCCSASVAPAHKIYMNDGSVIRADTVWEETLGYFMDEVSLYAYKKAGMPEHLVKALKPLQQQLVRSKERLFQLIRQRIGADALTRYQPIIEKYLVQKDVVSYDKFGDTIHLEREKVNHVEYSSPPPSLKAGFLDQDDTESRHAIEQEKALLYERLRTIREQKSAYAPSDESGAPRPGPVNYKQEMRNTQQRIKELERDPVSYFLRYHPELVDVRGEPRPSDCYTLCDGASAGAAPPDDEQKAPLIRAASDEKLQRYKRCMDACLQGDQKAQTEPEAE